MRLKSFYAKTMTEAMQMVRDTLGEDAIIVATREEQGGKAVRVTAAVDPAEYDSRTDHKQKEPAFEVARAAIRKEVATDGDWLQYDEEEDNESAVTEEITDAMLHHNVPEDVMDHILSCATVIGLEQPSVALIAAIEHLFHFVPLPQKIAKKPIMLVGPPGAGKTLAVAKLATRAAMNNVNVAVITTDTVRAGGVEQLKAFTDLLGVELLTVETPENLSKAIEKLRNFDQIIIDTPGVNPFETEDIRMLTQFIKTAKTHIVMVLPAGIDATESGEMARAFSAMGAQMLLPTRIDMARRIGGLLAAAHHGSLGFTEGCNSSKVSSGIFSLNPKILARIIMPHAYKDDDNSRPLRRTAGD